MRKRLVLAGLLLATLGCGFGSDDAAYDGIWSFSFTGNVSCGLSGSGTLSVSGGSFSQSGGAPCGQAGSLSYTMTGTISASGVLNANMNITSGGTPFTVAGSCSSSTACAGTGSNNVMTSFHLTMSR